MNNPVLGVFEQVNIMNKSFVLVIRGDKINNILDCIFLFKKITEFIE